jgi:3-isopropylmalate/(R)-2-methylmalate dehydratase small subunit
MEAFISLDAVAAPLARINVDTDQIVPALYLQKPRSDDFGDYLFHDVRHDAAGARRSDFVLNDPVYAQARILVAGRNFGCGSSREHAVWALHDGGFRTVIAPSFGDIFFSNALKNGLLPVRLPEDTVQSMLAELAAAPGARLRPDRHAARRRGRVLRHRSLRAPLPARGPRRDRLHADPARAHRGLRTAPRRRGRVVPFLPLNS